MTPYTWTAVYRDGSRLDQVDPSTGRERCSGEIDRAALKSLVFWGPGGALFVQHCSPGQRVFYRRRTERRSDGRVRVCHIIGWWRGALAYAAYVLEPADGGTPEVLLGEPAPGDRWRYPVDPFPFEEREVE